MLFNSYVFILFFIIVLFLHNLPLKWHLKKTNLLCASYFFYSAWNPPFVFILWTSTVVDWFVGLYLYRVRNNLARNLLLAVSLCVNLGLLCFFKYAGFLLEGFAALMKFYHLDFKPCSPDIILPVGISFYTFQTLSYTLDIYQRRIKPWHSFLDYALYVTFFPQLVAGPIVRASDFLPQCIRVCKATWNQMAWGISLFVLGLFEKIVVADGLLAPVSDAIYNTCGYPDFVSSWCATFAFSGQIFCDFAGYSTCAIGVAMCLGFSLPDNFNYPYASVGFSDFWQRWHISLSSWLRDYLYFPLGGNRCGILRNNYNLMMTMLLCGLWHGASWTFVAWGGLHGLYLVAQRALKTTVPDFSIWRTTLSKIIFAFLTYLLVSFAWVFFRSKTFDQAFLMIQTMLGMGSKTPGLYLCPMDVYVTVLLTSLIFVIHWRMKDRSLEKIAERVPAWLISVIVAGMLVLIVTLAGEDRAFIYFRF